MCANDMVILSESVYIHFVPLPKTKFNILGIVVKYHMKKSDIDFVNQSIL